MSTIAELPFAGRERELESLENAFSRLQAQQPVFSLVDGVSGIGKTSLIEEFLSQKTKNHPELVSVKYTCDANTGQAQAYKPFLNILQQLAEDDTDLVVKENSDFWKFSAKVFYEFAPDLVTSFIPGSSVLLKITKLWAEQSGWLDKKFKKDTDDTTISTETIFKQYTDVISNLSEKWELMLVLEDIQWMDDSSLQFLEHLLNVTDSGSLCVLLSINREEIDKENLAAPIHSLLEALQSRYSDFQIRLNLAEEEQQVFVSKLVNSLPNEFDQDFHDELFKATGGHTLSVVQLIYDLQYKHQMVFAENKWSLQQELDWSLLPSKLEEMVFLELDSMPNRGRRLLEIAAVEGVQFTAQVLAEVSGVTDADTVRLLERKLGVGTCGVDAVSVLGIDEKLRFRYSFRSRLIQRHVYDSLSQNERILHHRGVATALERLLSNDDRGKNVLLAFHFEHGYQIRSAIDNYQLASEQALLLSAHAEAIRHLDRCLQLLPRLPADESREHLEFQILIGKGASLIALKGYAATELGDVYNRAFNLLQSDVDFTGKFPAIWGLWAYYMVRSNFQKAIMLAKEMQSSVQDSSQRIYLIESHHALGVTHFNQGEFLKARDQFDSGLSLFDPEDHGENAYTFGQDVQVALLCWKSWAEMFLGNTGKAIQLGKEGLKVAREKDHKFSLGFALIFNSMLYFFMREAKSLSPLVDEVLELSEDYEFTMWEQWGHLLGLWRKTVQGDSYEDIGAHLNALDELGITIWQPFFMGVWCELALDKGMLEQARHWHQELLTAWVPDGTRYYDAYLLQVQSNLYEKTGDRNSSVERSKQAQEIASRQGNLLYGDSDKLKSGTNNS